MSRLAAGRAALAMYRTVLASCSAEERRQLVAEGQQVVLAEHERLDPAHRDEYVRALVSHVRCIRPEQMSPLSLWEPTEPVPTSPPTGDRAA